MALWWPSRWPSVLEHIMYVMFPALRACPLACALDSFSHSPAYEHQALQGSRQSSCTLCTYSSIGLSVHLEKLLPRALSTQTPQALILQWQLRPYSLCIHLLRNLGKLRPYILLAQPLWWTISDLSNLTNFPGGCNHNFSNEIQWLPWNPFVQPCPSLHTFPLPLINP